ncbi:MAG: peroxiredoxin-like family protein [Gaiellaceae bacterium]
MSDVKETENIEQAFAEHAARLAAMAVPDAVRVGDGAPNFELPNARGEKVRLSAALASGPVVLVFYRGAWCPYCNTYLRALQEGLEELTALGATLVAISPQSPDSTAAFVAEKGFDFGVLSDVGSHVASDYGLTFEFAEVDKELFLAVGNDLRKVNGSDTWMLPVPATYVIDVNGQIQYAHIDPNYTQRPDLTEILAALREITARSA